MFARLRLSKHQENCLKVGSHALSSSALAGMVLFQIARLRVATGMECCEAAEHSLRWVSHWAAVFGLLLSALIATATGFTLVGNISPVLLGVRCWCHKLLFLATLRSRFGDWAAGVPPCLLLPCSDVTGQAF